MEDWHGTKQNHNYDKYEGESNKKEEACEPKEARKAHPGRELRLHLLVVLQLEEHAPLLLGLQVQLAAQVLDLMRHFCEQRTKEKQEEKETHATHETKRNEEKLMMVM